MPIVNTRGYSLIELIVVVLLMGILATVAVVYVGNNVDATRYEETLQRLDTLRKGILGDDSVDKSGHKSHFGFVGDIGRLPSALTELTTRGSLPTWVYNYTNAPCTTSYPCPVGAGWRGPYVNSQFTTSLAVDKDAWGNSYVYNTSTAQITSYGADGAAGGTGYAKDVVLQIPTTLAFSTVRGIFSDGDMKCASQSLSLVHPTNGLPSFSSATTSTLGDFSFSSIPYGVRGLIGGSTCAITPVPITFVVDSPTTNVAPDISTSKSAGLQLAGGVSLLNSAGSSADRVRFDFAVLYPTSSITPTYVSVSWTSPAYLRQIIFDPTGSPDTQTLSPGVKSGTRFAITTGTSISIPSANEKIDLLFTENPDGIGYSNMTGVNVSITIEWSETTRKDTLNN